MSCHDVQALIPVQPGAYVAVFENRETGEFRTRPVVAIAAMNHSSGDAFEPVTYEPGWSLEVPDHVQGACHGMFTPFEAREYIEAKVKAKKADA